MNMTLRLQDLELLDAVRDFTLAHPHPDIARFKPAMRDWGDRWSAVEPAYLPAADTLSTAQAYPGHDPLIDVFARHRRRLRWEQSYTREDSLVPETMLDGYAFTETLGQCGPFVSLRIRAGIGVWGPGIHYPRHHHRAEEIYLVLAGSAQFSIGDMPPSRRTIGDVVFVPSDTAHGFDTSDELLVVFYLWQAGDLRQQSTFG